MKKIIVAVAIVLACVPFVFSLGNSEKLTTFEGEVVIGKDADGKVSFMLKLEDGSLIRIGITEEESVKLQLKANQRIAVQGVFIGSTEENKVQEKILARTMTMEGKEMKVANPVQLTEQERLQVRAYESEQAALKTQTQTKTMTGESSQASGQGAPSEESAGTGTGTSQGTQGNQGTGK